MSYAAGSTICLICSRSIKGHIWTNDDKCIHIIHMRWQGTLTGPSWTFWAQDPRSSPSRDLLQESKVDLSLILQKPTVFNSFDDQSISGNAKRLWLRMWTYSRVEYLAFLALSDITTEYDETWWNRNGSITQLICVAKGTSFHRTQVVGVAPSSDSRFVLAPGTAARLGLRNVTVEHWTLQQCMDLDCKCQKMSNGAWSA